MPTVAKQQCKDRQDALKEQLDLGLEYSSHSASWVIGICLKANTYNPERHFHLFKGYPRKLSSHNGDIVCECFVSVNVVDGDFFHKYDFEHWFECSSS